MSVTLNLYGGQSEENHFIKILTLTHVKYWSIKPQPDPEASEQINARESLDSALALICSHLLVGVFFYYYYFGNQKSGFILSVAF